MKIDDHRHGHFILLQFHNKPYTISHSTPFCVHNYTSSIRHDIVILLVLRESIKYYFHTNF